MPRYVDRPIVQFTTASGRIFDVSEYRIFEDVDVGVGVNVDVSNYNDLDEAVVSDDIFGEDSEARSFEIAEINAPAFIERGFDFSKIRSILVGTDGTVR